MYTTNPLALALTFFGSTTQASTCTGNTYEQFIPAVAEQPLQCSGQLLGWGIETGPGISPCLAPANATCAMVADQTDGVNCTINLYYGGGACDPAFRVGAINCVATGAAYGAVFDRFDVQCV